MDDLLADYRRVLERVDAHAARLEAAWPREFACGPGCSGCCQRSLTVFPVEAASIRAFLASGGALPPSEGEPFVSPLVVLEPDEAEPCSFLDGAGRCRIFPVRPVICRSHGLPLAVPDGAGGLRGDCCPLNFREGMGNLPSSDFLSLVAINTLLAAVDARYVAEGGGGAERVALSTLAEGL